MEDRQDYRDALVALFRHEDGVVRGNALMALARIATNDRDLRGKAALLMNDDHFFVQTVRKNLGRYRMWPLRNTDTISGKK